MVSLGVVTAWGSSSGFSGNLSPPRVHKALQFLLWRTLQRWVGCIHIYIYVCLTPTTGLLSRIADQAVKCGL